MSEGAEGTPDPGTDPEATPTPPAAEPTTTDSRSGPPEAIPYGRFKEVNDQLRPFKDLEEYGYDADSLRELAEWDANFSTNPAGNWLQVASQLDDLPPEVKAVVAQHLEGQAAPPATGGQKSEAPEAVDEVPEWAQPMLSYINKQEEAEKAAEEEADQEAFDQMLTDTLQKWDEKDKEDGLVDEEGNPLVGEEQKLTFIIAAAGRGGFENVDKLLEAARSDALKLREAFLKPHAKRPNSPRPVPGGGVPPTNDLPPPKTLSEASARAREFLENS